MKKRAIIIGALLGISILGLSGCKSAEEPVASMESSVVETAEGTSASESALPGDLALGESEEQSEERTFESKNPSTIVEDEKALYFCGRQHILKWDKTSGQTDIIWMTDKMPI